MKSDVEARSLGILTPASTIRVYLAVPKGGKRLVKRVKTRILELQKDVFSLAWAAPGEQAAPIFGGCTTYVNELGSWLDGGLETDRVEVLEFVVPPGVETVALASALTEFVFPSLIAASQKELLITVSGSGGSALRVGASYQDDAASKPEPGQSLARLSLLEYVLGVLHASGVRIKLPSELRGVPQPPDASGAKKKVSTFELIEMFPTAAKVADSMRGAFQLSPMAFGAGDVARHVWCQRQVLFAAHCWVFWCDCPAFVDRLKESLMSLDPGARWLAQAVHLDIRELLVGPMKPVLQEFVDNNSKRLRKIDKKVSDWHLAVNSASYLMAFMADSVHRDPALQRCAEVHALLGFRGRHGNPSTFRKLDATKFSTRHFADGWTIRRVISAPVSEPAFTVKWGRAHPAAHLMNAQSVSESFQGSEDFRAVLQYVQFGLPFSL
jgi:hypothetical protein